MQERRRIKSIILKVKKSIFRYANMKSNLKMVLFYTGLSKPLFEWLLKYVPNKIVWKKLKLEDHLLMTLVKLRRGITNEDLAYRFRVTSGTVSKILRIWIVKLAAFSAKYLIYWPEKMALRKNLPKVFKGKFSKSVAVIDCMEIFNDRSFDLNTRART